MNADMLNRGTEDCPPFSLSLSPFFLGGGDKYLADETFNNVLW
jgi:hypothetical protein